MWKNLVTAFKVKVPAKVQNVSECFVGMISSGWQNILLSNLIMAMQYHEPECHAEKKKKIVCCLQVQGHSEGSYSQM